ncbi:MAG: hypothetical protein Ta2E_10930 [Mycoplasmoidaceae bacterium]|nr:MAG: hypothetical protein Ta2E_10930 [Mycoplasmoidaceae bacterium]
MLDIAMKSYYQYGKLDKTLVRDDMKQIFVFTDIPYVFIVITILNNEIVIQPIADTDFLQILKDIVIGDYSKETQTAINLKMIFDRVFCCNVVKN